MRYPSPGIFCICFCLFYTHWFCVCFECYSKWRKRNRKKPNIYQITLHIRYAIIWPPAQLPHERPILVRTVIEKKHPPIHKWWWNVIENSYCALFVISVVLKCHHHIHLKQNTDVVVSIGFLIYQQWIETFWNLLPTMTRCVKGRRLFCVRIKQQNTFHTLIYYPIERA